MHCTKISPEFEFGDQKSKVKVTGVKKRKTAESSPLIMHSKACAVRRTLHAAADDTIASQPGGDRVTAVHADGSLRQRSSGHGPRGPCVRQFYAGGKISACCLVSALSAASVCLSVCPFVCLFVRMITSEPLNVG